MMMKEEEMKNVTLRRNRNIGVAEVSGDLQKSRLIYQTLVKCC